MKRVRGYGHAAKRAILDQDLWRRRGMAFDQGVAGDTDVLCDMVGAIRRRAIRDFDAVCSHAAVAFDSVVSPRRRAGPLRLPGRIVEGRELDAPASHILDMVAGYQRVARGLEHIAEACTLDDIVAHQKTLMWGYLGGKFVTAADRPADIANPDQRLGAAAGGRRVEDVVKGVEGDDRTAVILGFRHRSAVHPAANGERGGADAAEGVLENPSIGAAEESERVIALVLPIPRLHRRCRADEDEVAHGHVPAAAKRQHLSVRRRKARGLLQDRAAFACQGDVLEAGAGFD